MNDIDLIKLKKEITQMRVQVLNGENLDYQSKYGYLFEKTPSIFFLIKDNEEDYLDMLNMMLSNLEYVRQHNDSIDTALTEKHNEVNKLLAEKYIYPVVGKPGESSNNSR